MVHRGLVCIGAALLVSLVACTFDVQDAGSKSGGGQGGASGGADPAPATPSPPPTYGLMWTAKVGPWAKGVLVAPWGDAISYGGKTLEIHDRKTGVSVASVEFPHSLIQGGANFVDASTLIAVSERGIHKLVFPSLTPQEVVLFDPDRGEFDFDNAKNPITASVAGKHVAVGWPKGTVKLYGLPDGEELQVFKISTDRESVALSPDGERLVIGHDPSSISVCDPATGKRETLATGHGVGSSFAFSPDGKQLFADVDGWKAKRWDLGTNTVVETHKAAIWTTSAAYLAEGWVLVADAEGLRVHEPGFEDPVPLGYSGAPASESAVSLATFQGGEVVVASYRNSKLVCLALDPEWTAPDPVFDRSKMREAALAPSETASNRDRLFETQPKQRTSLSTAARSFLGDELPEGEPTAYFVRLRELKIGGEFDAAADEEVVAELESGGASRRLMSDTLDLPGGRLSRFTIDSPYVELVPAEGFALGVDVDENDLTEWEKIARTKLPLKLDASDFKDTETQRELGLTTITLTEGVLLWAKTVTIEGATATIGWIKVPRRDAKDADSREAIRAHLGAAVDLPLKDRADAKALGAKLLTRYCETANRAAGDSLHTRVRRVLTDLADEANSLGQIGRDVGALSAVPARLESLKRSAGKLPADLKIFDPLRKAVDALAGSPPPKTAQDLDRLLADAVKLGALVDPWSENEDHPTQALDRSIQALLTTLQLAKRGVDDFDELKTRYAALNASLKAELE